MYCAQCGKEIAENSNFCQHCGCSVQTKTDKNYIVQEETPKETFARNKKSSVLIIFALFTFVGILVAFFTYKAQHKYDDIAGTYVFENKLTGYSVIATYENKSLDEYYFDSSFNITIKGSGDVYGLWFANSKGTLTPRKAEIKSCIISNGKATLYFDVLDHPEAIVTFTIDLNTGKATYYSEHPKNDNRSITLFYKKEN